MKSGYRVSVRFQEMDAAVVKRLQNEKNKDDEQGGVPSRCMSAVVVVSVCFCFLCTWVVTAVELAVVVSGASKLQALEYARLTWLFL